VETEPGKVSLPDIEMCCEKNEITPDCMKLCSYNVTVEHLIGAERNCLRQMQALVECAGGDWFHKHILHKNVK